MRINEVSMRRRSVSPRYLAWVIGVWLVGSVGCQHPTPQMTPAASVSSQMMALCRADHLLYKGGDPVTVRAFALSPDGTPIPGMPTYDWTAEVGTISSQGQITQWLLPRLVNLPPQGRRYEATVVVRVDEKQSATCKTQIIVAEDQDGSGHGGSPPRRTRGADTSHHIRGSLISRALLVENESLEEGYGLYSFIVLTQAPRDTKERAAIRGLIDAWYRSLQPLEVFTAGNTSASLNVTYVPITESVPESLLVVPDGDPDSLVNWLVDHYNYPRAHELLVSAGHPQTGGPYLLSSQNAPQRGRSVRPRLLQDLEGLTKDQGPLWIRWFIEQTAREDFSSVHNHDMIFLKMKLFLMNSTDVLKVNGFFPKIGAIFFRPIDLGEKGFSQAHQ